MIVTVRRGFGIGLATAVLGCASTQVAVVPTTEAGSRLVSDLSYLAGPALRGRLTGTPGNDSAAAFIARRYAALGLRPAFEDPSCHSGGQCSRSFLQPFQIGVAAVVLVVVLSSRGTPDIAPPLVGS